VYGFIYRTLDAGFPTKCLPVEHNLVAFFTYYLSMFFPNARVKRFVGQDDGVSNRVKYYQAVCDAVDNLFVEFFGCQ